ncbi:MAG: ABC transporter substrate-binding protein [Frankiaceae bacterium]|nr:ABC transporter substrate-binding protein [Frankiaceae bacterium]MBV9869478.1 ABC transporter substrate-binding protein [Frankiaceae bacterium]
MLRGGVALAALALGATACGGSSSGGGGTSSSGSISGNAQGTGGAGFPAKTPLSPSTATGGTMNVGVAGDVDYLDPGRTYYAFSWDIHQLINRTLLTFPDGTGPDALVPTGDIATGPATASKGNTVWKYTLKPGVKFQDGTTVTSQDIKYAIERTFATDVINGGPTYFSTFLCPGGQDKTGACKTYAGPYKGASSVQGLSTIKTPDATHIEFDLNQPFAEWNYVMTLFGTSPVEQKVDQAPKTGGANYNNNVQATGPYEIKSYAANKHIDLVRNPHYDPATDGTRPALPDKINITTSFDSETLDNEIVSNSEDLDIGGTGVQPATQQKILGDASLKARALDPITGFTRYLSIMQETPPFDNVHCRKAIEYAMSRNEQKLARGGSYGGAVATTLGPPTLAGWKNFNLYGDKVAAGDPDIANAKKELTACGQPNGFKTTIVTQNQGKAPQQAQFLQGDLKKVGIDANIKQFDPATYYSSVIGVPANMKKNGYGLAFAGWGPDWPAPYGYFENIVDPRKILPQGNSNYGACSDPKITDLITQALKQATPEAEYPYWQKVDQQVLADACVAPFTYDKALDLFSNRLKNVYIEPQFGIVDLRTLGVA